VTKLRYNVSWRRSSFCDTETLRSCHQGFVLIIVVQGLHFVWNLSFLTSCHSCPWVGYTDRLAHTAACEAVWAIDVFAFSSSFLSVDGMTCHISF
jgi:hypothetical protein